ncbi:uncharacterized protein PV09_08774 [Verruconis gallopava]|uniref:Uncharacterized protein n=1 Tax=Verruconis gallopava TaxID=253628 RepID=A0A0D2AKR3_9PEZI|nr:uncharacterized protein PV09_08774 [Verruconis gallopava]KIV99598.1 hypothetical protein PV09_08774 [Verruconis gallopava]
MGPKAATPDERLQFILQCLHSIRDADGKVVAPNYRALSRLLNIKKNTAYVRYRDIVNREISNGVPGLQPVGKKAIAMAAAKQKNMASYPPQLTPSNTPNMTVPTATCGPSKDSFVLRDHMPLTIFDYDEHEWDSIVTPKMKKQKVNRSQTSSKVGSPSRTLKSTPHSNFDLGGGHPSFLCFSAAADPLSVGVNHAREEIDLDSEADAEGETDSDC